MKNISKILLSLILLAALSFTGCEADPDPLEEVKVSYRVTNSVAGRVADIEYTPDTGHDVELKNEELPWLESYTVRMDLGDVLILTVKAREGEGKITAEILVNDVVVESESDDELIALVWSGN